MSRIGLKPIKFSNNVTVTSEKGGDYGNLLVSVKGPLGEASQSVRVGVNVSVDSENSQILVTRSDESKQSRAYHGLYKTLIENMVIGVTNGYMREVEIHGVGYRAKLSNNVLEFNLGYNKPITFPAPVGITFELKDETQISIKGIDKQLVGETAALIRKLRKPEPYKGKGIRYKGEVVRRKVGKAASK